MRKPDWLKEDRGHDVLASVQRIPVVTFLQIAADMAVATGVPDGHGHRYVKDLVNAWALVLQTTGMDRRQNRAPTRNDPSAPIAQPTWHRRGPAVLTNSPRFEKGPSTLDFVS